MRGNAAALAALLLMAPQLQAAHRGGGRIPRPAIERAGGVQLRARLRNPGVSRRERDALRRVHDHRPGDQGVSDLRLDHGASRTARARHPAEQFRHRSARARLRPEPRFDPEWRLPPQSAQWRIGSPSRRPAARRSRPCRTNRPTASARRRMAFARTDRRPLPCNAANDPSGIQHPASGFRCRRTIHSRDRARSRPCRDRYSRNCRPAQCASHISPACSRAGAQPAAAAARHDQRSAARH